MYSLDPAIKLKEMESDMEMYRSLPKSRLDKALIQISRLELEEYAHFLGVKIDFNNGVGIDNITLRSIIINKIHEYKPKITYKDVHSRKKYKVTLKRDEMIKYVEKLSPEAKITFYQIY